MARGRTSPFAKGAGGKFVTLAIEMQAEKAHKEFKKLEEETKSLKEENKKLSRALDEQTKATKKNEESQKKNRKAQNALMDEQTKRIIVLQGMTSALNQMTGATYKMIAGAEASSLINEEQARKLQDVARVTELATGALEFRLAIQTLSTAMEDKNTVAKGANTAATVAQTKAQVGLNAAMMANPVGMAVAGIGALIAALFLLEMKFGSVTKAVGFLRREIQELIDAFNSLRNLGDLNLSGFGTGGGGKAKDSFFNRSRGTTYGSGRLA